MDSKDRYTWLKDFFEKLTGLPFFFCFFRSEKKLGLVLSNSFRRLWKKDWWPIMEFRSGYLSSSRSRKEESSRYHIVVAYTWYFRVTTSSQNQPTNRKKNRRVISKMDFNRKENHRRRRRFGSSSLVLVISCNFDK